MRLRKLLRGERQQDCKRSRAQVQGVEGAQDAELAVARQAEAKQAEVRQVRVQVQGQRAAAAVVNSGPSRPGHSPQGVEVVNTTLLLLLLPRLLLRRRLWMQSAVQLMRSLPRLLETLPLRFRRSAVPRATLPKAPARHTARRLQTLQTPVPTLQILVHQQQQQQV